MTSAADTRVAWVRELISQETALDGDKPAVTGWLQRLCHAAKNDLPAMGVGISLLSRGSSPFTVAASSPESVVIEELQFAMAEGPASTRLPHSLP